MNKKNFFDSFISYVSPSAALRRERSRIQLEILRKYEAASKGRRTSGWITATNASANSVIAPALHIVRDRVRDLVRNNPYAGNAVSVIEGHTIGTGIMSSLSSSLISKRYLERLSSAWLDWCESVDSNSDGLNNFYSSQALAMRSICESGEILVVRKWVNPNDGYSVSVPFQIELVEADLIDTNKTQTLANGNFVINGVEFNQKKKRVAYWLFSEHPGETLTGKKIETIRVDAKDVIHLFRVDRPGQVRGISWGAPTVIRLKDFDEFEDAQLIRQKIAAMFAGFIKDMETPSDTTSAEDSFAKKLESGAIEFLPPGKDIVFPNIPSASDDGHSVRVLRAVAKGWGISYEALTGDLSQVNYSSARMGHLEFQRNVRKWQWNLIIPRFCNGVFKWFLESAQVSGYQVDGVRSVWTPPKIEMIDPTKEIPAIVTAIRSGLQTLPDAIREQGNDVSKHLEEIKNSNDELDKLELILDCDPRKTMKTGIIQQPAAQEMTPVQN